MKISIWRFKNIVSQMNGYVHLTAEIKVYGNKICDTKQWVSWHVTICEIENG